MVMVYILYSSCSCNLNMQLVTWIVVLDIAFVILFLDFYWKAYKRRKSNKEETKPITETNGKVSSVNGKLPSTNGVAHKESNGVAHKESNGVSKKDL